MNTPAQAGPGDGLSPEELVNAWASVVGGCALVTRMLATRIEQETGLPAPSFFVLHGLLRSSDGCEPLSTLARKVAFSSGGFTKVADRLEQAGLIERQPSRNDRRVTHAVLTPAGRELAERASDVYSAALREYLLTRVGHDEIRALADMMGRLTRDLPPVG